VQGCLDDNTAAEFASGALPPAGAGRVEGHLATCRACRLLVAALAVPSSDSEADTVPREPVAREPRGKRGRPLPPRATATTQPAAPTPGGLAAIADRGPRLGDTVGRYLVLGRLGAGGMGVVLSAYDPQLDRRVALKLLRAGLELATGEARARLVREAQAIAQLSHPNVVAVHDVGTAASGEVYVAMELVDGETLTRWLDAAARPWREVLDLFLQAGRGLAAAHAVGLLHRDFKPDNVLVGGDGRVRVTDFGLARSLLGAPDGESAPRPLPAPGALHQSLTATGTVLGTPRYMAPEQLRGDEADARADQFSFCVALYEALYGRHPLRGDTAQHMIDAGERPLEPPEGLVPSWLGKALVRGLDPAPARRFPSMSALLGELAPIAPPRRRWAALGVGAVLVAGGAALALVATPSSEPPVLPDGERSALVGQIAALQGERARLLAAVARQSASAEEVRELRDELRRRDEQIQRLVEQVAAAQASREAPRRAQVAAAPTGLSRAAADDALAASSDDAADCLREWWSRHPDDDRVIAVALAVGPEGRTHSVTAAGMGADPTVDCVALAIGRTRFASRPMLTRMMVTVRFVDGVARLEPTIVAVEPAPPAIDLAGAPR
jgi:hypothetical protein